MAHVSRRLCIPIFALLAKSICLLQTSVPRARIAGRLHAELAVDLAGIDLSAILAMVQELVAQSATVQVATEQERRISIVALVHLQEAALVSLAAQRLKQVQLDHTVKHVRRSGLLHKLQHRIQGQDPPSSEVHKRLRKA